MKNNSSLAFATLAVLLLAGTATPQPAFAQATPDDVDRLTAEVMPRVIAWRRDIHQHPELGNREVRTANLVADHLASLGLEVQTGVAHTGVVGAAAGAGTPPWSRGGAARRHGRPAR